MKSQPSRDNNRLSSYFSFFKSFFSKENKSNRTFEDQVVDLIKEHDDGNKITHLEGRLLLHNIIEFGALNVSDIMISRNDIVAIDQDLPLDSILEVAMREGYARFPVYHDRLDNILGFVHIKDLLPQITGKQKFDLQSVIRPLLFAVSSMKIIDLLVKMRSNRTHMALVLDEYSSISGLVTIEDLLEQIVGNIEDEHDEINEPEYINLPDGNLEVSARISIEKLEKLLNMNIFDGEEEDCETLSGLIFLLCSEIPKKGSVIDHPMGLKFEIIDADPRNLKRIKIIRG